jgi:hypothetical protein
MSLKGSRQQGELAGVFLRQAQLLRRRGVGLAPGETYQEDMIMNRLALFAAALIGMPALLTLSR